MKLTCYGAARTTTGSMHLLEINGSHIMLDCGLYQGRRKEAFERNRNIPLDVGAVDACVLSHAHIDHSGNLPSLVKNGYEGPIYATPATRDLCDIMLADSAYLQVQDVRYVNKRRLRQGKNPFEPLYTPEDIPAVMDAFRPLPYERPMEIAPGVNLTFKDAGHILGSAFVQIDVKEDERTERLVFTGDVGRKDMPILADPVIPQDVDVLMTESTYGNRHHPKRQDVKAQLQELCEFVMERKSRLVIPSFSVGRTQQIVYFLRELYEEGAVRELPIYVDSPLSTRATAVHQRHPECFDEETRELLRTGANPFSFPGLTYVTHVEESKALNIADGPLAVISASGMCEGGRILHHLKHTVEDANNVILIVGYQAEHTLGRRIVERHERVRIFGEYHPLNARVHVINALSAHADHDELLDTISAMGPGIDQAFVIHGELEASEQFASDLKELEIDEIVVPEPEATYDW